MYHLNEQKTRQCFLVDEGKISWSETQQDARSVYEYTRPVVRPGGGEDGGTKSIAGLPSCAPHPFTKHRIHHFVYFSQLSAYKRGLCAAWQPGHSLNQPDKEGPLCPPRSACQKGPATFLSLPSSPHTAPRLAHLSGSVGRSSG